MFCLHNKLEDKKNKQNKKVNIKKNKGDIFGGKIM